MDSAYPQPTSLKPRPEFRKRSTRRRVVHVRILPDDFCLRKASFRYGIQRLLRPTVHEANRTEADIAHQIHPTDLLRRSDKSLI